MHYYIPDPDQHIYMANNRDNWYEYYTVKRHNKRRQLNEEKCYKSFGSHL